MKKMLLIVAVMLAAVECFAVPEFTEGKAYVFDKRECGAEKAKDNIRIIKSRISFSLDVLVYGYSEANSSWEACGEAHLKSGYDTSFLKGAPSHVLKKYNVFALVFDNMERAEISAKKDGGDVYISISRKEPQYDDITKYQEVVDVNGLPAEAVYNALLLGCVKAFNNSNNVIKYKDSVTKTISGKAITSYGTDYYFCFTLEAKDGRFRVTFDELEAENWSGNKHAMTVYEYDDFINISKPLIAQLRKEVLASKSGADGNW